MKTSFFFTIDSNLWLQKQQMVVHQRKLCKFFRLGDPISLFFETTFYVKDFLDILKFLDLFYFAGRTAISLYTVVISPQEVNRNIRASFFKKTVEKKANLVLKFVPHGFVGFSVFWFFLRFFQVNVLTEERDSLVLSYRRDLPETQKFLKILNRTFTKKLYFRLLYSVLPSEFYFRSVFRTEKRSFDCLIDYYARKAFR